MADVNERSLSNTPSGDRALPHFARRLRDKLPAPIFRFRSKLPTLKVQILPRILLALRPSAATAEVAQDPAVSNQAAIEEFAALTLGDDDDAAVRFIDGVLAQGASVEAVFLSWLAPAARILGEQWEIDATDFANVTIGVSRLHRIMRQLGDEFCKAQTHLDEGESMLLTTIPGEQHSFGMSMVAEFFRRAGWNLCTGPFDTHRELTSLVHNHWFDVVGFSVSSDRRLDELKRDIADIRRNSRNRSVGIMLGGPMIQSNPELVAALGADMMSLDAATAPQVARSLIDQMKCQA